MHQHFYLTLILIVVPSGSHVQGISRFRSLTRQPETWRRSSAGIPPRISELQTRLCTQSRPTSLQAKPALLTWKSATSEQRGKRSSRFPESIAILFPVIVWTVLPHEQENEKDGEHMHLHVVAEVPAVHQTLRQACHQACIKQFMKIKQQHPLARGLRR